MSNSNIATILSQLGEAQTDLDDLNEKKTKIQIDWGTGENGKSQFENLLSNLESLNTTLSGMVSPDLGWMKAYFENIRSLIQATNTLIEAQNQYYYQQQNPQVQPGVDEPTYYTPSAGDRVNITSEGRQWANNHGYATFSGYYYIYDIVNGNARLVHENYPLKAENISITVPTTYLERAATGSLGMKSNMFMVNEAGIEAMVTPDGTVISAPTPGYGVIKNEYTERLTDFAADPMQFLNKEFSGYVGNYKNNQDSNQIININGNLSLPNVTNGESFVDSIKTLALQYTTRRR